MKNTLNINKREMRNAIKRWKRKRKNTRTRSKHRTKIKRRNKHRKEQKTKKEKTIKTKKTTHSVLCPFYVNYFSVFSKSQNFKTKQKKAGTSGSETGWFRCFGGPKRMFSTKRSNFFAKKCFVDFWKKTVHSCRKHKQVDAASCCKWIEHSIKELEAWILRSGSKASQYHPRDFPDTVGQGGLRGKRTS